MDTPERQAYSPPCITDFNVLRAAEAKPMYATMEEGSLYSPSGSKT